MIAVTGATGHIGSLLVNELILGGEKVRAIVPKFEDTTPLNGLNVEIIEGDVRKVDSIIKALEYCDVVYHLAGIVTIEQGKSDLLHQVNVVGTRNVVDACLRNHVRRLIYTSSVHAIHEPPHGTVIDETLPYAPDKVLGDYAKSKARASLEVLKGVRRGLDVVIVCPTGVIGPNDYRPSEMGELVINVIRGKLKGYLDGAYDFVDVRDVVRGLILACEKGRSGESYILSGEQITIRDLFLIVEEITGAKAPSFKVPGWLARTAGKITPLYYRLTKKRALFTSYSVEVLSSNSVVSSKKARCELGYHSRPLRESVADSIRWFRENGRL
jgi:dihydroflavonol-4-reductase